MKKEIFLDRQKIVYYEKGKGFPFLILHGWGGSVSPIHNLRFQEILSQKGFRVFVICLPGFGESSLPALKTKDDEITESVIKFADKLNIGPFFIYGHCFGGLMAVKIAKLYPKKIKGIILCAIPSPLTVKMLMKLGFISLILFLLIAELFQLFMPPIHFLKRLRKWLQKQFKFYKRKRGVMWRAWKRIMLEDFKEVFLNIEKIEAPALIIRGAKENILIKQGGEFFKKIPNSILKIISQTGHSVQLDAPEKLVEEIVEFVKKIGLKEEN